MDKIEQENTKDSTFDKFRKNKEIKFIMFLALIAMVIGLVFGGKSSLYTYYPYFLIIFGLLAMIFIKDPKIGILIFLFVLTLMFPIQLFYYGVAPLHDNYVPITIPYMQQMFQMFGKFHIVYYPDYPQQGDTITAYIDVCDNELKNCTKLDNYTITAYFKDEGKVKHYLLNNQKINESFSLPYYGRPVFVSFLYGNTPAFSEFIIPRPSFYQSVAETLSERPIFTLIGFISSCCGLVIIFKICKKLILKINQKINS